MGIGLEPPGLFMESICAMLKSLGLVSAVGVELLLLQALALSETKGTIPISMNEVIAFFIKVMICLPCNSFGSKVHTLSNLMVTDKNKIRMK